MVKKRSPKHRKGEEKRLAGAERFEFTATEVAGLLQHLHLRPVFESPLRGITDSVIAANDVDAKIFPEQREALERLASPEIKLNLVCCQPPEPALIADYYGVERDGDFVLYEQHMDGMHRLAYPVNAFSLFETGARVLDLEQAAETSGITLVLDRAAFEAMVGIVDLIQEHTLSRMLERRLPAGELAFSAEEIASCCARTIETMDNRWMVPRAILAAPMELSFRSSEIEQGLEWLEDAGALQSSGKQFGLKSAFSLICSRLISCTGLFAVSTQRRAPLSKSSPWLHEHCAGLRCAGGLWQLEFFDITESDFKVTLLDVTPQMLYGRLIAALFPQEQSESNLEKAPAPVPGRCDKCNAILKPGNKFCTQCGAPVPR